MAGSLTHLSWIRWRAPDSRARFALHSAVGPSTSREVTATHDPRPAGASRRVMTEGARQLHGCTQATRLACPPGRATRSPRDQSAEPRRVLALPRDEAATSRLSELWRLPGPPRGRAEAGLTTRRIRPLTR